jgi:hypothetical protein
MINKRLFGSPIPEKVAKKLKDRQRVAGEAAPGESISGVFNDSTGVKPGGKPNVLADLSSRTPFVRMWTAVKFIDKEVVQDTLKEFDPNDEDEGISQLNTETARSKAIKYSNSHEGTKVIEIDGKFYIKPDIEPRDQVEHATKIYTIGNHVLSYINNTNPNTSLSVNEPGTTSESGVTDDTIADIFPGEQESNNFLKPPTGITSVTSNTDGGLGIIKKTSINFEVHNFSDFDKIYNRYFLKPGATIFVDFGWSTSTLYKPEDLINSSQNGVPIKQFLYGEPDKDDKVLGKITENQGDLEILQGIVTNYDAKIMENGSVQCMVEITSANSSLMSFETDTSMTRNIQNILTHGILYLGVQPTLSDNGATGASGGDDISDVDQFTLTPDADTSTDDLQTFNNNLKALAQRQLGQTQLTPGSTDTSHASNNTIRTGVFINSLDVDDVYISWGLFEDLIINSQFGFGKNVDEINEGEDLQVRLDSSNSVTTYSEIFLERQTTLSVIPEEPPTFILPVWWGFDIDDELAQNGGSYSYQVGKTPQYPEEAKDNELEYDRELGRIPIREVFINTDKIISSLKSSKNVREMLKDLLKTISDDSNGTWDWQIISGETDSELMIIDKNRVETQELINQSGDIQNNDDESESKNQFFEDLFIFDVMSKNSIVKGYDVNFNLPQGNIGNMYAIQAMSHENKMFPITDMIDEALALSSIDKDVKSILYLPDNSAYRASQMSARKDKDASIADIYENAQNLLGSTYTINTQKSRIDLMEGSLLQNQPNLESDSSTEESPEEKQERLDNEKIDLNIQKAQLLGYKVATNFSEYYRTRLVKEITMAKRPNLLPITLTLTTYGISSIQPGDCFRVDYLPNIYKNSCYFQVIRTTQAIGSEGWYTTLETQFRIRPEEKKKMYEFTEFSKTILSPRTLQNLNISGLKIDDNSVKKAFLANSWDTADSDLLGKYLMPYITNLRVKRDMSLEYITLILSFKTTSELSDALKEHEIYSVEYKLRQDVVSSPSGGSFTERIGNVSFYHPPKIKLEPLTEYFLVIQDRIGYITDKDGIKPENLKSWDTQINYDSEVAWSEITQGSY